MNKRQRISRTANRVVSNGHVQPATLRQFILHIDKYRGASKPGTLRSRKRFILKNQRSIRVERALAPTCSTRRRRSAPSRIKSQAIHILVGSTVAGAMLSIAPPDRPHIRIRPAAHAGLSGQNTKCCSAETGISASSYAGLASGGRARLAFDDFDTRLQRISIYGYGIVSKAAGRRPVIGLGCTGNLA